MDTSPKLPIALKTLEILENFYPDAHCALDHRNPYELLVATILSAQCTDIRVNQVTKDFFRAYPDVDALAAADIPALEEQIRSTGFFRNKARHLKECAERIRRDFHGIVPATLEELVTLPGIGRKTAERLLLELKGRLAPELPGASGRAEPAGNGVDVLRALLALGYSEREAGAAVKQLPPGLAVSDGIRQALRQLGKA